MDSLLKERLAEITVTSTFMKLLVLFHTMEDLLSEREGEEIKGVKEIRDKVKMLNAETMQVFANRALAQIAEEEKEDTEISK